MAQNVTIAGAKYSDVPFITVPKTSGGNAKFIDISDSTVTPETLTEGYTTYGANGEPVNGINPYELNATNAEVNTQADLIEQIQAALVGKSTIPEGYIKPEGTKSITENGVYDVTNYAAVEVEVAGSGGGGGNVVGIAFSSATFVGSTASEYLGG